MHNDQFFSSVLTQIEAGELNGGLHFLAGSLVNPAAGNAAAPVLQSHQLHQLLLQDPYIARAFNKPRGYAGDAVLIDMIYDQAPPPDTSPLGKDIFHITTGFPVSRAVRERRQTAAEMFERHWHAGARICALACGHLREADGLAEQDLSNVTAVDQDGASLSVVRDRHGAAIETVEANVFNYLRNADKQGERFDYIYTLGLTDYLDDRAMRLLHRLMRKCLNPGGTMVVANFVPNHIAVGWMDAVMDWQLIYRSEAELASFAHEIDLTSNTWLDPTGSIAWCEMEDRG